MTGNRIFLLKGAPRFMDHICNHPDDLAAGWSRYDWRENFLAPGLSILQALTAEGRTASGAGMTRDEAFQRCLGETAEIVALARFRAADGRFEPTRDGIAAHVDADATREAAACEAFERYAVARWWLGQSAARPVLGQWLVQAGLARTLAQARQGGALKRRTDWWQIGMAQGPCVMICRSMSHARQDPVLGYGVHRDPARAAEKALRENLLMELNLMELLAARSRGEETALHGVRDRIRSYALRAPNLFPDAPDVIPFDNATATDCDWFGTAPRLSAIATGAVSVWLCQPDLPVPEFTAETGSPYL